MRNPKKVKQWQKSTTTWVNEYRKEHNLPSYREERRIRKVSVEELAAKNSELEKLLKKREKELADEKETVEILKKSLHIFMRPHD